MRSMALAGMAIVLLLAGCRLAPVVLAPDSAPPEVVLDVYLRALESGNCDGADGLVTRDYARQAGAFCRGVRVTGYRVFSNPSKLSEDYVEFSLSLTTSGGDVSLPDGSHTWFYSVVRQGGGPWRIAGGGTGP